MPEPTDNSDEMRPEYGEVVFARGVRGKYFAKYQADTNLALLAPEIRAAYPTDAEVNETLCKLFVASGKPQAAGIP